MKKLLLSTAVALAACTGAHAQAADGTTAPDFTFTDINGMSHNLYTELNAGRTVLIDVSATWCGPCWYYHGTGWLDTMYERYDQPGNNSMRVWFFEGDPSTTMADMQGTTSASQGDWITGVPYTIANGTSAEVSQVDASLQIPFYPSLYMVCPNKKIYQDTINNADYPWPTDKTFEWVQANKCASAAGLDNLKDGNPLSLYPNPAVGKTTLYFALQSGAARVRAAVMNSAGQVVRTYQFNNLSAGDQKVDIDLSGVSSGIYFVSLECDGRKVTRKLTVR